MISLFHGTTMEVSEPLVGIGRKQEDFGRGFYLTKMKRQASLWAETMKFKGSVALGTQGGRNAR